MLVAKTHPGTLNVPYVAGMNCTNLPTTCFNVSNTVNKCHGLAGGSTELQLGTSPYTLLMWSSTMTAFYGDGGDSNIPQSDKLGGFVIVQLKNE
jgi:hypothetical protein